MPTLSTKKRKIALKQQAPPVANAPAENPLRKNSNLQPELALDGSEFARYAVSAIPAQLLGIAVGLRKGFSPDAQKNLIPAVVLPSRENLPAKRSGA